MNSAVFWAGSLICIAGFLVPASAYIVTPAGQKVSFSEIFLTLPKKTSPHFAPRSVAQVGWSTIPMVIWFVTWEFIYLHLPRGIWRLWSTLLVVCLHIVSIAHWHLRWSSWLRLGILRRTLMGRDAAHKNPSDNIKIVDTRAMVDFLEDPDSYLLNYTGK